MIRESQQQMSRAGTCSFGGDFLKQLENGSESFVHTKEGTITKVSITPQQHTRDAQLF